MTTVAPARISQAPFVNNLLTNGGIEIWQRGAGPFVNGSGGPAYGPFTADEWLINKGSINTDVVTVSRDASAPKIGQYCMQVSKTGTVAPIIIQQGVESWPSLRGATLTFSTWVKTSDSGVVIAIKAWNGTSYIGGVDLPSRYHTGSGQWELLTEIMKTPTTMVSVPFIGPHSFPLMVEIYTGGANTYSIDGAVLAAGYFPEGLPYVPPHPADDWERCQRFYQKNWAWSKILSRDVVIGNAYYRQRAFNTRMYGTPTITLTNQWGVGFNPVVGTVWPDSNGYLEARTASATTPGGYFGSHFTAEIP